MLPAENWTHAHARGYLRAGPDLHCQSSIPPSPFAPRRYVTRLYLALPITSSTPLPTARPQHSPLRPCAPPSARVSTAHTQRLHCTSPCSNLSTAGSCARPSHSATPHPALVRLSIDANDTVTAALTSRQIASFSAHILPNPPNTTLCCLRRLDYAPPRNLQSGRKQT
jgi:hypothetical protein